eukprot:TRINITY_DN23361_c0_g1_i1.p1 TRINITY_DN23361_c0_g1~~TRINITY_DN23361_c0_g1_i1.p1  ORF type:complete len:1036 (+),score=243.91 TRINITY_DN23361_c0_g1_i1:77-3109(+)
MAQLEAVLQLLHDGLQHGDPATLASVPGRLSAMQQLPGFGELLCSVLCGTGPAANSCDGRMRQAAGLVLKQLLVSSGGGDTATRQQLLRAAVMGDSREVRQTACLCVAAAFTAVGGPRGWPEALPSLAEALRDPGAASPALACLTALVEDHPEVMGDASLGCPMAGLLPAVIPRIGAHGQGPHTEAEAEALRLGALLMEADVAPSEGPAEAAQQRHAAEYVRALAAFSSRVGPRADPAVRRLLGRALGDSCRLWAYADEPARQAALEWALSQLEATADGDPAGAAIGMFWADVAPCEPAEQWIAGALSRLVHALVRGAVLDSEALSELSNADDAHLPDEDRLLCPRAAPRRGRGTVDDADDEDGPDCDSDGGDDDDDAAAGVAGNSTRAGCLHALSVLSDKFDEALAQRIGPVCTEASAAGDWRVLEAALQLVAVTAESCAPRMAEHLPALVNRIAEVAASGALPLVREAAVYALTEIGIAVLCSEDDDEDEPGEGLAASPFMEHILTQVLARVQDRSKSCQIEAIRGAARLCRHGASMRGVGRTVAALCTALPSLQLGPRREVCFAIAAIYQKRGDAAAPAAADALAALCPLLRRTAAPGARGDGAPALAACCEIIGAAGALPLLPDVVRAACAHVSEAAAACAQGAPCDTDSAVHALDICSAAADACAGDFAALVGGNGALLGNAMQLLAASAAQQGAGGQEQGGVHAATHRSLLFSCLCLCGDFCRNAYPVVAATPDGPASVAGFTAHHLQATGGVRKFDMALRSNALWAFSELASRCDPAVLAPHAAAIAPLCAEAIARQGEAALPPPDPEYLQNAALALAWLCAKCPGGAAQAAVQQDALWAQRWCAVCLSMAPGDERDAVASATAPLLHPQVRALVAALLAARWGQPPTSAVARALGPLVGAVAPDAAVPDPVRFLFALGDADGDGRWGYHDAAGVAHSTGGALSIPDWKRLCKHLGASPSTGLDDAAVRRLYAQGMRNADADFPVARAAASAKARQVLAAVAG